MLAHIDYKKQFIERFLKYIQEMKEEILNLWMQSAKVAKNDPFYKEILANGEKTLELIHEFVETRDVEPIIALTKKIAKERIEANVNISEYVYNINAGRSLVISFILKASFLNNDEKLSSIMIVDELFDEYVYYAIKEYTDLKDSIILNKNRFIQEMHHDRLTILGQIAASFAHEFRNPLTSIKGFIKMLEKKYSSADSESGLYFDIINYEMESLEDKVSRFLYLSKSKGLDDEMVVFDISGVTNKMIEFMYPRFVDENIEVTSSIQANCLVFAVKEQIKQVLLNILNNAVEELSELGLNRIIEIELKNVENEIILKISNNGKMIPAYLLENIFEPFVTTKNLGTGLGLSVVKQILEKHDGTINVESTENKTTFIMKWTAHKKWD
ncbi:MAG TPA: GHKL domain-containing protein [Bacillus bacterium]|nr:GHKL domain-containing protein [Bacillus sp. (in: firmicutes)]